MMVAIANDGTGRVSEHFGRSAFFEIYRVEAGVPRLTETRENPRAYAGQLCHQPAAGAPAAPMPPRGGRGAWVREALGDCDVAIAAGIAGAMLQALEQAQVRPARVAPGTTTTEVLRLISEGALQAP